MKKKVFRERYMIAKQDSVYSKEELIEKVIEDNNKKIIDKISKEISEKKRKKKEEK